MKFSCDRQAIAEAFQLVAGVAPQRSLKPILTRAKLTATKESISVEGTDFEVAVRCTLTPSGVEEEGGVAVPAEKVASILREASDEEIRIESRGEVVTVLDLRTVLGMEPAEVTADSRTMILESAGGKTGLLVDRVADVVATRAADTEPAPANVKGVDGRFFRGIYKLDTGLLVILDVETVLAAEIQENH